MNQIQCLPSEGPTPAGDSDRRGRSGAGWGRVEAAPPEAGRGSSRPSVSRLSVRRQACISKIMERQEGAAVSAPFLPPSSSVYFRLALVTAGSLPLSRSSRAQAQWLWHMDLVAPQHVGS